MSPLTLNKISSIIEELNSQLFSIINDNDSDILDSLPCFKLESDGNFINILFLDECLYSSDYDVPDKEIKNYIISETIKKLESLTRIFGILVKKLKE